MRGYETIFVTQSNLDKEHLNNLINKFKSLITKLKGNLIQEFSWGRRKLAYSIANQEYGLYYVWYITGNANLIDELHKQFRFSDDLLRFQSVVVEDLENEATIFRELIKSQKENTSSKLTSKKNKTDVDESENLNTLNKETIVEDADK